MRRADTLRVTKADMVTDGMDLKNPATFPNGGSRSPRVCPSCNGQYDDTGWHFGMTDCGYPILTQREASAFLGAWLAGGYINPPEGRGTPRLIVRSDNEDKLKELSWELGVCGRHTFGMSSSNRFQLNTTPHPRLEDLRNSEPSQVRLTRQATKVLLSLRATIKDDGTILVSGCQNLELIKDVLTTHSIHGCIEGQVLEITGENAEALKSWSNIK